MRDFLAILLLILIGSLFCAQARADNHGLQPSDQTTSQSEELRWYNRSYVHIGGLLSIHGWNSFSSDNINRKYDLTSKLAGGLSLCGYWVVNSSFNLGAYFNYFRGEGAIENVGESTVENFGAGASIKAGGRVGSRVWIGFVCDIGFYTLSINMLKDTHYGVEISPRFHLDVLAATNADGFKVGFFTAIGPSFIPYIKGSINGTDFRILGMTIQIRLGLTFGA